MADLITLLERVEKDLADVRRNNLPGISNREIRTQETLIAILRALIAKDTETHG